MSEVYDAEFEQARLDQLREKYLAHLDIQGELYFYACDEIASFDAGSYFMNEETYMYIKESGFRYFLFPLLDGLMRYRERCGKADCTGGHVIFSTKSIHLTWLGSEKCQRSIENRRGWL